MVFLPMIYNAMAIVMCCGFQVNVWSWSRNVQCMYCSCSLWKMSIIFPWLVHMFSFVISYFNLSLSSNILFLHGEVTSHFLSIFSISIFLISPFSMLFL